jgi:hypothetical protein
MVVLGTTTHDFRYGSRQSRVSRCEVPSVSWLVPRPRPRIVTVAPGTHPRCHGRVRHDHPRLPLRIAAKWRVIVRSALRVMVRAPYASPWRHGCARHASEVSWSCSARPSSTSIVGPRPSCVSPCGASPVSRSCPTRVPHVLAVLGMTLHDFHACHGAAYPPCRGRARHIKQRPSAPAAHRSPPPSSHAATEHRACARRAPAHGHAWCRSRTLATRECSASVSAPSRPVGPATT